MKIVNASNFVLGSVCTIYIISTLLIGYDKYFEYLYLICFRKEIKSNVDRSRILNLEDINKEFVVKLDRFQGITVYSQKQQPIEIDQLQDKLKSKYLHII